MKLPVLLFIASSIALGACDTARPEPEPVRPVLVQKVAPGSFAARDVYSGEVRARYEGDLAFRIGGKLVARSADPGARVKRGQVLARLDPDDARLAAQAAQAQLASAQSDLALAKAELDRYADLLAKKFVSASAVDAKKAAFESAQARTEQARSQAALGANQASYASLAADADGVIVSIAAEPGQVVAAGQPIVRLARAGGLEVVVNVPESQVSQFKPGDEAVVSLWAEPSKRYAARIREIAGGADPVTRTYAARVTVLQPPPTMQLGMTANVALPTGPATAAVLLPPSAVMGDATDAAVWIVDPRSSEVKRRKVTVGEFREDGVTVVSGLSPGELVVTAGVHKLRENQPVRHAQAL